MVADSGSTKAAWILADGGTAKSFSTRGLNPYHVPADEIRAVLAKELLPETGTDISEVYFYGAGCTAAKIPEMTGILAGFFPAARIEVGSDLLGACRGICSGEKGVVCILGTGSNSCLYDGSEIAANTPSLGYILGDEGSGTALGRSFVSDCLKNLLPEWLKEDFFSEYGLTQAAIVERVYLQPSANRFLAGFAPFIASRRHIPEVRSLVMGAFRDFLRRNVVKYGATDTGINFAGSVAWHFADILAEAVAEEGLTLGQIVQSPIEGIAAYHTRNR